MTISSKRLQRELERFIPDNGIDISVDDSEDAVLHVNMKVRLSMVHNPPCHKSATCHIFILMAKGQFLLHVVDDAVCIYETCNDVGLRKHYVIMVACSLIGTCF